jgi:hypothetical protein
MIDIKQDGTGNPYIDINNLRVTLTKRGADGWAGESSYIRIQSYRSDSAQSQALHLGAELPFTSHKELCGLIAAISHLAAEQA